MLTVLGHFVCLFVRSLVCMSVCLAGGLCSGRVRVEFSAVTMTTDQIQTCISCMPTKALLVIGCFFHEQLFVFKFYIYFCLFVLFVYSGLFLLTFRFPIVRQSNYFVTSRVHLLLLLFFFTIYLNI